MKKVMFLIVAFLSFSTDSYAASDTDTLDWCVNRMITWNPPGKDPRPVAKETVADGTARYRNIASDAMDIAFDPAESPLYAGSKGRIDTLALMLSIASFESRFSRDVDFGLGSAARGDNGRSWCLMQVNLGNTNPYTHKTYLRIALKGDTFEYSTDSKKGYGGEDLVKDRKACFRIGLHIIRQSFRDCKSNTPQYRLAGYASGSCSKGLYESAARINKAIAWTKAMPAPADDNALMVVLHPSPVPPMPTPPVPSSPNPTAYTGLPDIGLPDL